MAEILASRCMQMLDDLTLIDKDVRGMIEDEVNGLVSAIKKIEVWSTNAHNSGRVPDNMQRLREFAYDVEDFLEKCAVEVDVAYMDSKNDKKKRGIRRLLKRCIYFRNTGTTIRKMAKMIRLEGTFLMWLHEMITDDGMESVHSEVEEQRVAADRRNVPWTRQKYAHDGMVEHFVEMEEDLSQLISLVTKSDLEMCVVSIWGVEGLGKTTLARKVYIDPQVRTHFNEFAWVTLSQGFQFGNLLQHMLKQLGGGAVKNNTAEELKKGADEKKKKQKKSADEQKKGADEMKKSVEEPKKEADEKKKSIKKRNSAKEQRKGEEEETKTGAEEQKKSSEETIIDQLKEIQRKKRCLIVIDGILEMDQWNEIKSAFLLTEGTNTRVLITTRDETIAGVGISHKPSLLDEDKGWELLQKYVFRGRKPQDLGIIPKLGKEMVKKCGNLPSAIASLGRTLSKTPVDKWHMVNDDVNGYLQRDNQSQSNERSDEVLDPNYGQLQYHLKECFLYLGIFKEDGDVDLKDLALLWMAEGITHQQEKDKEGTIIGTAEDYLRDLADKKMLQVQVDEFSVNRSFMRLCLHNHVRDLSLYQGEKEGFRLKVVDFSDGKQPRFDRFTLFDGIRRLVIHFNKQQVCSHELVATYDLRSLFFLNSDDNECVDLPVRISDFKKFKLLRVLHFVRCKFKDRKLPEGIENLVNLRYFGVLYCDLEELPPSISNFRNLHVLNVRACDDARIRIPNVLSQLIRLKHLHLPNNNLESEKSNKLELDGLLDLETLVGFNADIHDLDSLSKLEKLRLLVTHAYSNKSLISIIDFFKDKGAAMQTNLFIEYKCNFTSPEGLAVLEEVLMCPNLYALTFSMVLIHKFPNCGMHASSDLTQIKLIGCKLSEDPMEALGKFPNLQKLCLGYGAFVGKMMDVRYSGFRNLEYLEFRCLPNLEEWKVEVGAMRHLSDLIVRRCPKLKGIPKGLATISSSLKNMEIELPPSALAADKEAEYHQIFNFVKSRSFRKLDPLSSCNKDSDH